MGVSPRGFETNFRHYFLFILLYYKKVTPEGFEPPAFGFGIQRAAVAPWSLYLLIGLVLRSQQVVHGWDHSE